MDLYEKYAEAYKREEVAIKELQDYLHKLMNLSERIYNILETEALSRNIERFHLFDFESFSVYYSRDYGFEEDYRDEHEREKYSFDNAPIDTVYALDIYAYNSEGTPKERVLTLIDENDLLEKFNGDKELVNAIIDAFARLFQTICELNALYHNDSLKHTILFNERKMPKFIFRKKGELKISGISLASRVYDLLNYKWYDYDAFSNMTTMLYEVLACNPNDPQDTHNFDTNDGMFAACFNEPIIELWKHYIENFLPKAEQVIANAEKDISNIIFKYL